MKYTFESVPCSRCGGSGYLPYAVEGGRCFKCGGTKTSLTPAAAKLNEALRTAQTVPWSEVVPGDRVRVHGVTNGAEVYEYVSTVVSVEPDESEPGRSWANGVELPVPTDRLVVTYYAYGKATPEAERETVRHHVTGSATVVRPWSSERKQEWLAALAPHAGLLLDGVPTKPSRPRKSDEEKAATRAAAVAKRTAARLAEPASDKQLALIASYGFEPCRPVSKIEASQVIDRLFR